MLRKIICNHARATGAGCDKKHDWAGTTRESGINHDNRYRSYRIHLPPSYVTKKQFLLVVAYHGHHDNPKTFEKTTHFSDARLNSDMIVVYPQGVDESWQGPTYATAGVDDIKFTIALVRHLKKSYCIDSSRIYATGHSNGGGFVVTLACSSEGGVFAAFAPVSGAFYTDVNNDSSCDAARDVLPILEVHGDADMTIPYTPQKDGSGGPLPAISDWLNRWAARDGCGKKSVEQINSKVEKIYMGLSW